MAFDATQALDGVVVLLLALEVQVCRAIKAVTCNKPIAKILDIYNQKNGDIKLAKVIHLDGYPIRLCSPINMPRAIICIAISNVYLLICFDTVQTHHLL